MSTLIQTLGQEVMVLVGNDFRLTIDLIESVVSGKDTHKNLKKLANIWSIPEVCLEMILVYIGRFPGWSYYPRVTKTLNLRGELTLTGGGWIRHIQPEVLDWWDNHCRFSFGELNVNEDFRGDNDNGDEIVNFVQAVTNGDELNSTTFEMTFLEGSVVSRIQNYVGDELSVFEEPYIPIGSKVTSSPIYPPSRQYFGQNNHKKGDTICNCCFCERTLSKKYDQWVLKVFAREPPRSGKGLGMRNYYNWKAKHTARLNYLLAKQQRPWHIAATQQEAHFGYEAFNF